MQYRSVEELYGRLRIQDRPNGRLQASPTYCWGAWPYQITQRLPSEDGNFKYRIKSPHEPHECVANESELSITGTMLFLVAALFIIVGAFAVAAINEFVDSRPLDF
jgi:hypothetical protein